MLSDMLYSELLDKYKSPLNIYRETGILIPIAGGAPKGYNETADLLVRTVDGVPLNELYDEFVTTSNLFNAQRDPLIERLTFPITEPFEQVMQVQEQDFEEADEFGQPVGIRLPTPWNMGFTYKYFDLGIRYTFRYLGRATAGQLRALHNSALVADNRLVYRTVMTQLFRNTNQSGTIEDTGTAVTTYPFYNGATTTLPATPPSWKSYTHATSHNHYLASGAASVDSGDLDDMYVHIYHHGYVNLDTEMILLVAKQEADLIRKFRIAAGDGYDFVPAAPKGSANLYGSSFLGQLQGPYASAPGGGLSSFPGFIGWYGPWNIVQEDMIPAGYMVGLASGGPRDAGNPIGIREHPNEALRGLKLIPQFERYPLREAFYHHALGAGTRFPGKGVVMKITSGAYDIPTIIYGGSGGR